MSRPASKRKASLESSKPKANGISPPTSASASATRHAESQPEPAPVFPSIKIKNQLKKNEPDIGRILSNAVELVNGASTIFLQQLVQECQAEQQATDADRSRSTVITKDMLQRLVEHVHKDKYAFLQVDPSTFGSIPRYKGKGVNEAKKAVGSKKSKKTRIQDDLLGGKRDEIAAGGVGDMVEKIIREEDGGNYMNEIVEDEEDYD